MKRFPIIDLKGLYTNRPAWNIPDGNCVTLQNVVFSPLNTWTKRGGSTLINTQLPGRITGIYWSRTNTYTYPKAQKLLISYNNGANAAIAKDNGAGGWSNIKTYTGVNPVFNFVMIKGTVLIFNNVHQQFQRWQYDQAASTDADSGGIVHREEAKYARQGLYIIVE